MSMVVQHSIWGYQQHFRIGVELAAKRLFDTFSTRLDPEVFLVAVRIEDSAAHHRACIEPEQHHWISSSALYDVLNDVPAIRNSYPESQMFHSHPIAQRNQDIRLFRCALRDAIRGRLENAPGKPPNRQFFLSFPVERPPFLVVVVVSLCADIVAALPSVAPTEIKLHQYRSFRVSANLVEAAMDGFLRTCENEIVQPDAGMGLGLPRSTDEILREAGVSFFSGLLNRVDNSSLISGIPQATFDAVARVSSRTYEGALTRGRVIFTDNTSRNEAGLLTFTEPISLHDARAFRKLVELTNGKIGLHCDCAYAYGLIEQARHTAGVHCVEVEFTGRGKWTVSIEGRAVMVVHDRLPMLPRPDVDPSQLASILRRTFPQVSEDAVAAIVRAVEVAATDSHGKLFVVTESAELEAKRLARDGIPVEPTRLSPEAISGLAAIDGAIVCGPDARCHAFGVILDGIASTEGNRGRGARYNSAMRYVATRKHPTVAIVISEDGGVDVLPALRPLIDRREISAKIEELNTLFDSRSSDRNRQAKIIEWLEQHRSYLNQAECDSINSLVAAIDEQYAIDNPEATRWIKQPLKPDPTFVPNRDLA